MTSGGPECASAPGSRTASRRFQRTSRRLLAQRRPELSGPAPLRPAGDLELPGPRQQRNELRLRAGDRPLERHLAERRHVVHEPLVQRHAQPAQRDAVSKSEDGGQSWTEPVTLIDDANPHVFNDKNSLTADPNDSNLVYAIWDRLVFPNERSQGDSSAIVVRP